MDPKTVHISGHSPIEIAATQKNILQAIAALDGQFATIRSDLRIQGLNVAGNLDHLRAQLRAQYAEIVELRAQHTELLTSVRLLRTLVTDLILSTSLPAPAEPPPPTLVLIERQRNDAA